MLPNHGCNAYWLRQWLSSIPSIRIVIFDVLLWIVCIVLPSSNNYRLRLWLLLWKAVYGSSIGGGVSILYLKIHHQYDIETSICQNNRTWYVDDRRCNMFSYQYIGSPYHQYTYISRWQYVRWLMVQGILGYWKKIFQYIAHQYQVQYMLANGGQYVLSTQSPPAPP